MRKVSIYLAAKAKINKEPYYKMDNHLSTIKLNKAIKIQKVKNLIKDWQNTSVTLRDKGEQGSANIIDECVNKLTNFLPFLLRNV